ncbi:MAG: PSD1 and planctomycete cytochrome C domain-containing protein [Pirellulales bacterium]|nr:PSD1 and planctomycete cytochrome C domain-containing protein [Pirellulales bacterium]
MVRFKIYIFACVWFAASMVGRADDAPNEVEHGRPDAVDFDRYILPILASKCFACHGPDGEAREAELRLDSFASASARLESGEGRAVVPGDLDASVLWQRIVAEDKDQRMPPLDSNRQLTSAEIKRLGEWIESGAEYQQHWAFRPIRRPKVPAADSPWIRNPIDQFIFLRLEREALAPAPVAAPTTLMRRVSFDLTGLPPSYELVENLAADPSPKNYDRKVEQLLASPHYGERMAVRWLDLVRYADTVGYHGDLSVSVSPFRDYVIRVFNENMPFDQFTREQLAGDLLAAEEGVDSTEALRLQVASGYNRLGMMSANIVPPKVNLTKYAAERVRNVSLVWMGATVGCAECHDHKFDPYTAEDFYSLASFFADIKEKGVYKPGGGVVGQPFSFGDWGPSIQVPTPHEEAALKRLDKEIDSIKDSSEANVNERLEGLSAEREAVAKSVTKTNVTVAVEPREMRVLARGNWQDTSGNIVAPAIPRYFGVLDVPGRATRLDLADWLVSRDNPLTARVAMNRLWHMFFGRGLSASLADLGQQAEAPSHPALLDWLAAELVESGWDVKHMIRLIVTSATYCQSSISDEAQRGRDPYNALLSRQGQFRLDAEFVRDNALAVSGLLVRKLGGRSVFPYQPAGYYRHLNFPVRTYPTSEGEDLWRRTLYTHWQRLYLHPSLMAFDAPAREECTVERSRSNTPLASLVLMNDPIYVEAARRFAERILQDGPPESAGRIAYAYRQALGREPRGQELEVLAALEQEYLSQFRDDPDAASELVAVGVTPVTAELDTAELAAWTGLVRVIFNSHEFITRY